MSDKFLRARSPEHKTERLTQILEAAGQTIYRVGLDKVTMSEIAKLAGLTQSAFYRYFKSKEEIFAHLLIMEAEKITRELSANIDNCSNLVEAAELLSECCARQPLFCTLASDLAPTLERNISLERLIPIKQQFSRILEEWVSLFLQAKITGDHKVAVRFIQNTYVVIAGLWPITRDRPLVRDAAKKAGLNETFNEFESELSDMLVTIARGLDSK